MKDQNGEYWAFSRDLGILGEDDGQALPSGDWFEGRFAFFSEPERYCAVYPG